MGKNHKKSSCDAAKIVERSKYCLCTKAAQRVTYKLLGRVKQFEKDPLCGFHVTDADFSWAANFYLESDELYC